MVNKNKRVRSNAAGKTRSISKRTTSSRIGWDKSCRSESTCKSTVGAHSKGTSCARGYGNINNVFESKVKCFRMLCDQTRGTAKGTRPTPAHLKTFANWVNKGANIYKVTNTQMNKWCSRECERSIVTDTNEPIPDLSNPQPNCGWRRENA